MNRTITALRKLFLELYQEAKVWSPEHRSRGRKPTTKAQQVWEKLSSAYWWAITDKELEKWLPVSNELQVDFSDKNRVLYLPPLEKDAGFVPVLSLKCHISETKNSIRLRVMMVSENDEEGFYGIGFRMESPEMENVIEESKDSDDANGNEGRHDFYHAQLITSFGASRFDQRVPIGCPSWLPVTQPSFPLTAECPVTLVFSLLLALYGKNYCRDFLHQHNKQPRDLQQHVNRLNEWIKWR